MRKPAFSKILLGGIVLFTGAMYFSYLSETLSLEEFGENILEIGVWNMWTAVVQKLTSSTINILLYKNRVLLKQTGSVNVNMSSYGGIMEICN
jgi:hypothetical protein